MFYPILCMNLNHHVGLSRNSCECYNDLPDGDDFQKSLSGLYVDEEPNFSYCRFQPWPGFWGRLKLLREEAIKSMQADLGAGWRSKLKTSTEKQERIGQGTFTGPLNSATSPYGLTIKTADWGIDGNDYRRLNLDSLAIMGTVTGGGVVDVTVTVTNENTSEVVRTLVFTGVGSNQTVRRPIPEETPIDLVVDGSVYSVRYTTSAPFVPANNAYHCNCGDKLKGLAGYILENVSNAEGLSILVKAGCPADTLLQLQLGDADYSLVLAFMLRGKILENLLVWLAAQPEINRYTLLDRDGLKERITYYQDVYASRLDWLLTQTPVTDGWCYSCTTRMQRVSSTAGNVHY